MTDWMKPQQANVNMKTSMTMGEAAVASTGKETAAPSASAAAPAVMDISTEQFGPEVMEGSKSVPVIVDFWAEWCGPCKQLGPIIEAAVEATNGAVRLVKMDVDKNPEIPGQMRIQSIPAVVTFIDGKPADAFMGAKPESEIKEFIAKAIADGEAAGLSGAAPQGGTDMSEALDEALALFADKDFAGAAETFAAILQHEPGNLDAIAGLGQCYLAVGEFEQARGLISQVPEEYHNDDAMTAFVSALELAEQASDLGDLPELAAKVEQNPKDHEARFDYAVALNARGEREEAAEQLLAIIAKDRKWRDDGAREQLLEFFGAWGHTDPATISARRSLSSLLFS